jgi:hypothetical protein
MLLRTMKPNDCSSFGQLAALIECNLVSLLTKLLLRALLKFAGKMGNHNSPKHEGIILGHSRVFTADTVQSRLPGPSAPIQNKTYAKGPSQFSLQSSRVWIRIRIRLENGGLEKLLDAMGKDLFRLERLLETSAKLPVIRRHRKNKLSKKS